MCSHTVSRQEIQSMGLLETLYRSPFGRILSLAGHVLAIFINRPFMVYGLVDPKTRLFRKFTRISSTSIIMNKQKLAVGDHIWVGHYCILDVTIEFKNRKKMPKECRVLHEIH